MQSTLGKDDAILILIQIIPKNKPKTQMALVDHTFVFVYVQGFGYNIWWWSV